MTKADIVSLLVEKIGLQKAEAQLIVEVVIDNIKDSLLAGETVKIAGFGTFTVKKKNSRIGRNPKTKVEVEITPRRVVTFKVSDQLKKLMQNKSKT
ncbi:MAG: integration host factor subunit alpha [Thermodesulfovibrionales bacterium]|nr:integration host factor subunit alpha [Thermodesulfovibrionales bacterium]